MLGLLGVAALVTDHVLELDGQALVAELIRLARALRGVLDGAARGLEHGFFLKGGLGFSRLEISGGGVSVSDQGLGLTAGLGYDVRLGTNFSLSPYLRFVWGHFEGGSANHGQLGLGVTWHKAGARGSAPARTRTWGLPVKSRLLYQLSYRGAGPKVV